MRKCGVHYEPCGDACCRKFCPSCGAASGSEHVAGCAAPIEKGVSFKKGDPDMTAFDRAVEMAKGIVAKGEAKSIALALGKVWDDHPELYDAAKREPRPAPEVRKDAAAAATTPTYRRIVEAATKLVASGAAKNIHAGIDQAWRAAGAGAYRAHLAERASGLTA